MNLITTPNDAHWYTRDGKPQHGATLREARTQKLLPSVTTKLQVLAKPQLDIWKQTQAILSALTLPRMQAETDDAFAKRVVQDSKAQVGAAADFGLAVHAACEAFNAFGEIACETHVEPFVEMYRRWHQENVAEVFMTERVLLNPKIGYAGTVDLVYRGKDGKNYLADIKTQKYDQKKKKPNFYETWGLQLAAYKNCEGMPDIHGVKSLAMDSVTPGPIDEKLWEEDHIYFQMFCLTSQLWDWTKNYYPGEKQPLVFATNNQ